MQQQVELERRAEGPDPPDQFKGVERIEDSFVARDNERDHVTPARGEALRVDGRLKFQLTYCMQDLDLIFYLTEGCLLMTRETVVMETPLNRATSSMEIVVDGDFFVRMLRGALYTSGNR